MPLELWRRPWALVDLSRRHRQVLEPGARQVGSVHRGALWLYSPDGREAQLHGRKRLGEPVSGFAAENDRRLLALLPFPLRRRPGVEIEVAGGVVLLTLPEAPERPPPSLEPQTKDERLAYRLMLRAKAVWDRLYDVDDALADPARVWTELRRRWTEDLGDSDPRMDVIVRHATRLARTLEELGRRPRHILRRRRARLPIARVQELDRHSMLWLARQPGETLAERAGDDQRILAVAREENFDTLENRVFRAYAELALARARDYAERNRSRQQSQRMQKVEDYGRRCNRHARELVGRDVRRAEPGVTPNFVLQENPTYHQVWVGWQELLNQERVVDDLWRWQARSWEEFCALGVMVALAGVPGAHLIASAPLGFRDEQMRGSWITHDNPLGVFHLPAQDIVVEVRYRMARPDPLLADFGAPIWVRIGSVGDAKAFLSNIAVWPLWDVEGGLVPGEADEIDGLLPLARRASLTGGIVIRPTAFNGGSSIETAGRALALTLGTDDAALREGLAELQTYLTSLLTAGSG